ncbi:hypothetical protein [Nocardioides sp. SR21]|nr:hypothetical protein [Nocardioides sp. SR21]
MNTKTNDLTQHWVEVTDVNGQTRLEARWIDASYLPTHTVSAA